MAAFRNQDAVIREVGKAYDHIKQLQALLHFKPRTLRDDALCISMTEMARSLFEEALQGLNHSLHMMKSGMHKIEMNQEIISTESGALGCRNQGSFKQRMTNRRSKRKRTEDNSWTCTTTMPYDDGYQWRKYGDKKITAINLSRSYFRCTFKEEQGCMAKKLVQETINKDLQSLFHVTYTNKHTCNSHAPMSYPVEELAGLYPDQIINIRDIYIPPCNFQDDGQREAVSNHCSFQRSSEWDVDALIMELVGFDPSDANLILT